MVLGLRLLAALALLPLGSAALPAAALAAPAPSPQPAAENWRNGSTLIVTERQNGDTLLLRRGETLQLVFSANSGTGYSWDVDQLNPKLIEPLGGEIRPSPGQPLADGTAMPMPGAPQQITFLFRALRPGRSTLSLKFWRRWEGEASISQRFRVQVVTVGP